MSDTTLGDLTNSSDMHHPHLKKSSSLGFKEDNVKEILKAKLDVRNQSTYNNSRPPHHKNEDFEKENTQLTRDKDERSAKFRDNENSSNSIQPKRTSENNEDGQASVLAERRSNIKQAADDDSPDDNDEEDEKENAMNKLKALLGNSRPKPTSSNSNQHKNKNSSSKDKNNNNDFLHVIDRMRRDLFNQLYITDPDELDEDEEGDVSRIFYDGRDGQQHTIDALQSFFKSLKSKAKQFAHHYESVAENLKLQHQSKSQGSEDNKPVEDEESDKERIKKKLTESKKQAVKQSQNSKDGLKSLLNKTKAPK